MNQADSDSSLGTMAPLLIVSTGRTGTVSIAENFRVNYSSLYAVHEPFGSRIMRVVGNMHVSGILGFRTAALVVRLTHGLRRRLSHDRQLIESNPHACCLIPVFCRLYPDITIVHVVRHPADFVRSYIDHGAFNGLKGYLGKHLPYWFLRPEHLGNREWPRWNDMSPIEASAWRWSILNHVIERDCDRYAKAHVRIRYEDLFHGGPAEWMRISTACGLDPSRWQYGKPLLRANASFRSRAKMTDELYEELKDILEKRCAGQLEHYGYSL